MERTPEMTLKTPSGTDADRSSPDAGRPDPGVGTSDAGVGGSGLAPPDLTPGSSGSADDDRSTGWESSPPGAAPRSGRPSGGRDRRAGRRDAGGSTRDRGRGRSPAGGRDRRGDGRRRGVVEDLPDLEVKYERPIVEPDWADDDAEGDAGTGTGTATDDADRRGSPTRGGRGRPADVTDRIEDVQFGSGGDPLPTGTEMDRLVDKLYRELERKMRIERERRGL